MRPRIVVGSLAIAVLALGIRSSPAAGIKVPCGRPFGKKAVVRQVDTSCPNEGKREKDWSDEVWAANRLENMAKNEFCATGPTRTLTMADFIDLQHQAEALREAGTITYGDETHQPADRAPLRAIGEGTRVRLRGFILGAHDAKPNFIFVGGESCNCLRRGERWNDIHITLAESPDADACEGIVAEMTPHFRPWLWDEKTLATAASHPVVVEGHLFFDSEHEPCGGKGMQPKRVSTWEIHPVYELYVCRQQTIDECPLDVPGAWVPLADWFVEPPGTAAPPPRRRLAR